MCGKNREEEDGLVSLYQNLIFQNGDLAEQKEDSSI